jgi:poly-gamma-glutamate synthesis protein (capsule biosynthesis protein)
VEQGFQWVHGKPVFWSLGDYVFNGMDDTPGGDKGIFIVLSYLGAKLLYIEAYPVFMNGPRTEITAEDQLARFYRLTKEFAD